MSRPASRIGFNYLARKWAEGPLKSHDEVLHSLGKALVLWVELGDPERRGLQQCLNACYLMQMSLETDRVESQIIPVYVQLMGTRGDCIGVVGAPGTGWAADGTWTGHCALWIPSLGGVLDPTIGQCPGLDGWGVETWQPLFAEGPQPMPGSAFRVNGRGYIADYSVLEPSTMPGPSHPDLAELMKDIASIRERLA